MWSSFFFRPQEAVRWEAGSVMKLYVWLQREWIKWRLKPRNLTKKEGSLLNPAVLKSMGAEICWVLVCFFIDFNMALTTVWHQSKIQRRNDMFFLLGSSTQTRTMWGFVFSPDKLYWSSRIQMVLSDLSTWFKFRKSACLPSDGEGWFAGD